MNSTEKGIQPMLDQEAAVKSLVAARLRLDEGAIDTGAHFTRDLGVDSFDLVELIVELEEVFGIVIGDPSRLATLDDVVAYVRQATAASGPARASGDC